MELKLEFLLIVYSVVDYAISRRDNIVGYLFGIYKVMEAIAGKCEDVALGRSQLIPKLSLK